MNYFSYDEYVHHEDCEACFARSVRQRARTYLVVPAIFVAMLVSLTACAQAVIHPTPEIFTVTPTDSPTPTNSPTPANSPTPVASATPAPTTTATPIPELFRVSNNLTGLRFSDEWNNLYRDPGAVVYHDGKFHMFFNGINGYPRPVGVGYAASTDGENWEAQTQQPVFHLGPMEHVGVYSGPNLFVTSALVEADGTWVLYYYNLSGNSFEGPQSIGRASAPSPLGPWTPDPQPVLMPGTSGEWDERQVSSPTVLKTEAGYIMYYDGTGRTSMIGMATSTDGKNWTKYNDPLTTEPPYAESDPVLMPTGGSWDARRVLDPNVIKTNNGWVMIYLSADGSQKFNGRTFSFGLAVSIDGIAWAKVGNEPALSTKNHSSWGAIYLSTLVWRDNVWRLYFDVARQNETNISLATFEGDLGP